MALTLLNSLVLSQVCSPFLFLSQLNLSSHIRSVPSDQGVNGFNSEFQKEKKTELLCAALKTKEFAGVIMADVLGKRENVRLKLLQKKIGREKLEAFLVENE